MTFLSFTPPQTVQAQIASHLQVADLSATPKKITVRLQQILGKDGLLLKVSDIRAFQKTWVINFRHAEQVRTLLLSQEKRRVSVVDLYQDGIWGGHQPEFRRKGRWIVGVGDIREGNSNYAAALISQWTKSGWGKLEVQESDREGSIRFKNDVSLDAICTTRNYELKAFNQPHMGPLLSDRSMWKFRKEAYLEGATHLVHNALFAFDDLVDAIRNGHEQTIRLRAPQKRLLKQLKNEMHFTGEFDHRGGVHNPAYFEDDQGSVFGFRDDESPSSLSFQMGLVRGIWQLVRVAPEPWFIRHGSHVR